jgi:hypothetical protein
VCIVNSYSYIAFRRHSWEKSQCHTDIRGLLVRVWWVRFATRGRDHTEDQLIEKND